MSAISGHFFNAFLVRHGESEWNKLNLFTGWTDVDLSEKGHEEAKQGGKILKEESYDFDVAYTSYLKRAIAMTIRVLKSIAVPMIVSLLVCDLFVSIGWIGMILKGMIPVKKIFLICCPVCGILFGQLLNYIAEGLDSGTESFGWLVMYLVCAISLTGEKTSQS